MGADPVGADFRNPLDFSDQRRFVEMRRTMGQKTEEVFLLRGAADGSCKIHFHQEQKIAEKRGLGKGKEGRARFRVSDYSAFAAL